MSEEMFQVRPARRKAAPILASIASESGGGKTMSALLLAAGIAGPNGTVGLLDTENGRGEMYADDPLVTKALPKGFVIVPLDPPFTPTRYIAALQAMEKAGVTVGVVDSTTHEWEGIGGCCDIAETNKLKGMPNWIKAKLEHKKFVNFCLSSKMHTIFCIRAREKVKVQKINGREEFVSQGIQPVCEKNFVFEMLISLQLDTETHMARPVKVPEALKGFFSQPKLVTKEDGEAIAHWNSGGVAVSEDEQLHKRARTAAEFGTADYLKFWKELATEQRKKLQSRHDEYKDIAERADIDARLADGPIQADALPPKEKARHGDQYIVKGQTYVFYADIGDFQQVN